MCDIPVEVGDGEKIVRAIIFPFHVDRTRTKLRSAAFKSKPGSDEVSVVRQTYQGSDFCKSKAREIEAASPIANAEYVGLAVLTARQIKDAECEVHDSRAVYCGHAHISLGITAPLPNEPLRADQQLILDSRLEALRTTAVFHGDPDPHGNLWTGAAL